ncbi:MAG: LLM class flavin-dependent oxidoreductase [Alphaproteobacteria bacterium]|nr:LLM class flavin-dependent oxidoreductase [Alphaproteobacteria bacterium]
MKIGLFDHLEQSFDRPLSTQFDERLEFAATCDEAGLYCLHVAEHHSSPLNSVPAPGVWLAAVARATKRMRMGPLVYLLPLYSPLRLAEEICILDHLSKGRLEVGVGRGVSPYEVGFHNIDHDKSREIFMDAYACLTTALTHDEFSYQGPNYTYRNVPMPLRPLQQPHPPVWYGSSNTVGAAWAGEQGMHFSSNGPVERAKENIAAYRAALEARGGAAQPKAEFPGGAAIGLLRHVVVAETDEEAERIARPALDHHSNSLNWLRNRHGDTEYTKRLNVHRHVGYDDWKKQGMIVAGSPATVTAEIVRQAKETGINYLISYLFFGTMTLDDARRSLALFRDEVMPNLADV